MGSWDLQPRNQGDMISMFQNLNCNNSSSQPSWPTASLTNSFGASSSSSSSSILQTAYQANLENVTHLQRINYANNYQSLANFYGGGFQRQQTANIEYNDRAPVELPSRAIQKHRKVPAVRKVEEDPDNMYFLWYLKEGKGWSERKIEQLEGSKKRYLLDDFYGLDLYILASYQLGSQYLQRIMNAEVAEKILDQISDYMLELMRSQYGCYVFQRLLLFISHREEQLKKIVANVVAPGNPRQLLFTPTSKYGSLSIQKLFQTLKSVESPLIENLMAAFSPYLFFWMMDVSGRHLIIDCLKHLSYYQNRVIYYIATINCVELAEHVEGYHIVSKVIDAIEVPLRWQLLEALTNHSVQLATSPNGNFVLQKIIKLQDSCINENICRNLGEKVVEHSMHKHGSHVIEKLMESDGMEHLVLALLESDQLIQVAKDQFGNYIIQKVLKNSKIKCYRLYQELVRRIVRDWEVIQNHPNAKNVLRYLDIDSAMLM